MNDNPVKKSVHNVDPKIFILRHALSVAFYSFWGAFGLIGFIGFALRLIDLNHNGFTMLKHENIFWLALYGGLAWMATGGVASLTLRVRSYEEFKREQFELAHAHLDHRPEPVQQHTRPAPSREIEIKTIRGAAVIVQPRAGAFAAWLKEVLNPDTKTLFSKNEAKRREWEDWQYTNLVAQLKEIGWLDKKRTYNGAPDVEGRHVEEMRAWINPPTLIY